MKNEKQFKFYLTKAQAEKVKADLQKAENAFNEGVRGAVFAQIGKGSLSNRIFCEGMFLPNDYAIKIINIIQDYLSKK